VGECILGQRWLACYSHENHVPCLLCACSQAPIFEMEFFQGFVRPSLHDAYTGWGEDLRCVWALFLLWPWLGLLPPAALACPAARHQAGPPDAMPDTPHPSSHACYRACLPLPHPAGLDFVWPFLLHYPRDRIAVIDDVCMLHPHTAEGKKGEGSIYAALAKVAPWDAREEEARRDAQFNYYPSGGWVGGWGVGGGTACSACGLELPWASGG
jgi:hypothetical protein